MKVHDEIESLTDVYLAGGLEAGERNEIEEHAASCGACAAVLRDAEAFHGWVSGSSAPGAPPTGLEDRIIANLRAATPGARRWPRAPRIIRILGGVAAVFALIVIGGIFTDTGRSTPGAVAAVRNNLKATSGIAKAELDEWAPVDQERGPSFRGPEERKDFTSYVGAPQDKSVAFERGFGGGPGAGERERFATRKGGKELGESKPAAPATAAPGEPMADTAAADHNESGDFAPEKKPGGEMNERLSEEQNRQYQEQVAQRNLKIIRNADLHLEVDAYEPAYTRIVEITRAKKGFVAGASTTKLANGKIRATVTVRIPPDKFEETLGELGKLGTVRHQAISTTDVTKQYLDLESRLKSKETLVERLKKVLLEGRGNVKELMEVEVQMGATIEQIEVIKGELKYYNDLVGMSTITMQVSEKDLGLPFEYVQTMQANIGVTAHDADGVYAKAQAAILEAGGQVADSRMTRANEDSATGFVRGKVDAEKFPAVRETLKALGHVDQDTVNQQQTGRGGQGDAKPGAPVRKEQAVIDFTVNTPPIVFTRQAKIGLESDPAKTAYESARREIEATKGGKILAGSMTDRIDGARAFVRGQVSADELPGLVEKLKKLGVVKSATMEQIERGTETGRPPLIREQGEIILEIATPARLLTEEHGLGKAIRETFARSVAGVLWSIEKLFVGIALAGPWILLAILVFLIWKRTRRAKTA